MTPEQREELKRYEALAEDWDKRWQENPLGASADAQTAAEVVRALLRDLEVAETELLAAVKRGDRYAAIESVAVADQVRAAAAELQAVQERDSYRSRAEAAEAELGNYRKAWRELGLDEDPKPSAQLDAWLAHDCVAVDKDRDFYRECYREAVEILRRGCCPPNTCDEPACARAKALIARFDQDERVGTGGAG